MLDICSISKHILEISFTVQFQNLRLDGLTIDLVLLEAGFFTSVPLETVPSLWVDGAVFFYGIYVYMYYYNTEISNRYKTIQKIEKFKLRAHHASNANIW